PDGAAWQGADDAIAELQRCREILACGEDGPGLAGLVARAEAVAAAARGSWSEAEAQFVKAVETFRRHGMVWQEAKTVQSRGAARRFESWGWALRTGADRRAAIEKLDMAIEIYRRHAASHGPTDGGERKLPGADGDRAPVGAPVRRAVFRREGDYWTVSWQGNV